LKKRKRDNLEAPGAVLLAMLAQVCECARKA
jgi:hypothetical protein